MRVKRWIVGLVGVGLLGGLLILGCGRPEAEPLTPQAALGFVKAGHPRTRGIILAVVTSQSTFGPKRKNAGYELSELSRAAYVFQANGYEVEIASPAGGQPRMRLDEDDHEPIDQAFLEDPVFQRQLADTLPLAKVDPGRYAGVYFVGGKGALLDFPDNPDVQRLVKHHLIKGVVGAVCHGPAALLHVKDEQGRSMLAGRRFTGFTNAEELFLNKRARQVFPFLLQDRAEHVGARFQGGPLFLDHCITDGRLVTGQNPWSTWSVAEGVIRALGHVPVPRPDTPAERSVRILSCYAEQGWEAARALRDTTPEYTPRLIRMHALVALMQGRGKDAWALFRLA